MNKEGGKLYVCKICFSLNFMRNKIYFVEDKYF
jgi:hypothetical protein